MGRAKILSILFLTLVVASQIHAQGVERKGNAIPTRCPVVLLPKYKLEIGKSVDGVVMGIWREGGMTLEYVQAMYLENPSKAIKKEQILWTQNQTINNQVLELIYTKSHELFATFPALNTSFSAKIHNTQELTDMLLMVVTYNVDGYPVEPALIAPIPKKQK